MAAEDPEPGDVLGKYRLLRVMGEGGMAVVFEAEHTKLGQKAAIKVLRAELAADPTLVERFEREGRAISKLKSRNVVRVLDVDETPTGAPYLVMELLDGWDLEDEIGRRGALPIGDAVGYLVQACQALAEAHAQGIVHRDIKPSNLFLTSEGGSRVLKVLDFGIAKDVPGKPAPGTHHADVRLTSGESVMGTPLYMAPEQFRATRDVDARADVWALGATLYELVAGRPPFCGTATTIGVSIVNDEVPSVLEARPDLPPALAAVINTALEKDRAKRYPSAMELLEALRPFSDGVVIAPRTSAVSLPSTREIEGAATQIAVATQAEVTPPKKNLSRGWMVAALALVLVGALGVVRLVNLPGSNGATTDIHAAPLSARTTEVQAPPSALVDLTPEPSVAPLPVKSAAPTPRVGAKPSARPAASVAAPSQPPLFFPSQ